MGKRWRAARGITIDDVWRSGTNSYVVLESAPDLRVTSCSRCQKVPQPVVEINATTMTDFGPLPFDLGALHPALPIQQLRAQVQRMQQNQHSGPQFVCGSAVLERVSAANEAIMRSEEKQLELFCFDNCKTHCTSSRLHLGSRLILVMLFPGNFTSFSEPFELLSKKPRNKKRKEQSLLTESQDPKQEVSMIQIPTALSMVPPMLLPRRDSQQPSVSMDPDQSEAQSQQPTMKSSLMDIAAAVAAEEIEAAEVAKSKQTTKMDDGIGTQQHLTPKQKKARLRDIAS